MVKEILPCQYQFATFALSAARCCPQRYLFIYIKQRGDKWNLNWNIGYYYFPFLSFKIKRKELLQLRGWSNS